MDSPPSSPAGTLDALRRLVRALRLADRQAELRHGVTAAQLFVLECLAEGPVESMSGLAERTMTDPSSVSVVVQRLAERGLVVRTPAPDDARRTRLRLSASGRRVLAGAPRSPQANLIEALERLPANDRTQLQRLLARLVDEMGLDATQPSPMFFEGEARPRRRTAPRRTAEQVRRRG